MNKTYTFKINSMTNNRKSKMRNQKMGKPEADEM